MKKLILVLLSVVVCSTTAEAQFFKKLKKSVEDKVEQRVTEKISNKAADEADKHLENIMTANIGKAGLPMGGDRVPAEEIPASYTFDWEYTMSMKTEAGDMEMVYLFSSDHPNTAIRMEQAAGMTIVQDYDNDLNVIYMSSGGQAMVTASRLPDADQDVDLEMDYSMEDFEIRRIGTIDILGYTCQGYEMENEDFLLTYYITDETEVSFSQLHMAQQQKNLPKGFDSNWFDMENAMVMGMDMKDKKNDNNPISMRVTKIEKTPTELRTADYQGF